MPPADPHDLVASFPELSASVGGRVKALRARRDMSLGALAAATGLGKGTLSELERGRRNPTLDTLFAIATALSVPLGDLLVDGTATGAHARDRSIDAELIGRWVEGGETVEVYRMTVTPGRRRSRPHAVGVIESITVISGEIEVGCDDAPALLRAGQTHTFAGDRDHFYEGLAERSGTVLVMRYPMTDQ